MESYPNPIQQPQSSAPKIIYCTKCGAPTCGAFCSNCGTPLRSEQPVYSPVSAPIMQSPEPNIPSEAAVPKRKKNVGLIVLCALTATAVVLMLTTMAIHFVLSSLPDLSDIADIAGTEIYRGGVSQEEYDRLELGMTYAHISSIIGGDGAPIENGSTVQGDAYYIYGWPGEYGDTAAVYITFTNDVATEITLDGTL